MLETIRASLKAKLDERAAKQTELDDLLAAPGAEKRDLNDTEAPKFTELRDAITALDEEIDQLVSRKAELEDLAKRTADRQKLAEDLQPVPSPTPIRVKDEPKTYRNEPTSPSFFRDVFMAKRGDPAAQERLNRHMAETRDVGTSAFGDPLVVPQFFPDMYAEVLRAGRVTANICTPVDLPPVGMTLNIPRGTTGTAVAAQSGDNSAVQETNFDETDLAVSVRTYAGMQDVSIQAWERGVNIDTIIYQDLASAYATTLNGDILNGAGTNGTHTGILQTSGISTVTASGTAGQTQSFIIKKIAEAIGTVNGARFMPATAVVMAPRRWAWLQAGVDSNNRPFVLPAANVPQNAFGVGEAAAYGLVGSIFGVPVWSDGGIPTTLSSSTFSGSTEDAIIVTRRQDLLLWEEGTAPRRFTFDEVGSGTLTIRAVVAGYSAFTAGWYPAGTVKITGSSLTTPSF